jgi:hypothetical protein
MIDNIKMNLKNTSLVISLELLTNISIKIIVENTDNVKPVTKYPIHLLSQLNP